MAKDIDTLQLCYGPRFNALKVDSLWNKAFELMDDVTRSEIIEDLKFFQKAWRGYEEKPVKDAQKILDGISALFGEENLCPHCNADLGGDCNDGYYENPHYDRCSVCGQRLDYSE